MKTAQIIKLLGGPAAVGSALGIRGQAVSQWVSKGYVPVGRVPGLVRMAKRLRLRLRAEQVRPDIDWAAVK